MVAICNIEDEKSRNPKTLGDWVKNFRLKKMQMKRKLSLSGNLRICAILSTALMTAELELRRKQQERFQKWLEFQTKIDKNHELQTKQELRHHLPLRRHLEGEELIMSIQDNDVESCKQSEEITNLWKCELSELDNFMRSISSSASKNVHQSNCTPHISDTIQRDIYQKNTQRHSIEMPIRRDSDLCNQQWHERWIRKFKKTSMCQSGGSLKVTSEGHACKTK